MATVLFGDPYIAVECGSIKGLRGWFSASVSARLTHLRHMKEHIGITCMVQKLYVYAKVFIGGFSDLVTETGSVRLSPSEQAFCIALI